MSCRYLQHQKVQDIGIHLEVDEEQCNLLTRWDVSSIPANGIFLSKNLKNKNKNAQRVENY